jgi:hypothetical protein
VEIRYAFFCEDLRHEVGGQVTAIGMWGARLNVPAFPAIIRSLAFHAFVYNPARLAAPFELELTGALVPLPEAGRFKDVLPIADDKVGTNLNIVFGGVVVERPGPLTMHVRIASEPVIAQSYSIEVALAPQEP